MSSPALNSASSFAPLACCCGFNVVVKPSYEARRYWNCCQTWPTPSLKLPAVLVAFCSQSTRVRRLFSALRCESGVVGTGMPGGGAYHGWARSAKGQITRPLIRLARPTATKHFRMIEFILHLGFWVPAQAAPTLLPWS